MNCTFLMRKSRKKITILYSLKKSYLKIALVVSRFKYLWHLRRLQSQFIYPVLFNLRQKSELNLATVPMVSRVSVRKKMIVSMTMQMIVTMVRIFSARLQLLILYPNPYKNLMCESLGGKLNKMTKLLISTTKSILSHLVIAKKL
jgi:hypothetical protein